MKLRGKTIVNFKVKNVFPGDRAYQYSVKKDLLGYPGSVIFPAQKEWLSNVPSCVICTMVCQNVV